jgi:hypothetical protein
MDNPVIDENGDKCWINASGLFHRDDGPAVECANGAKYWFQHDERHRTDGPAVEWPDGGKHWFQHGKRHRTDGPAVNWADGDKSWYLNGHQLTFDQWLDEVEIPDENKVMMKLIYG